jgi:hypothetical protein
MPSVFGSTIRCEHSFSLMKNVDSRSRSPLTDGAYKLQQQKLMPILRDTRGKAELFNTAFLNRFTLLEPLK